MVELEYKAPVWTFSPGSLGPPPQTYNGQTAMIVVTIVALVVVFGAMFIAGTGRVGRRALPILSATAASSLVPGTTQLADP